MHYQVLGPLAVTRDGVAIDLGSPKQRAVLAALAIEAGRVVPAERLIDQVWGDSAPANVAGGLQVYVSNLRRLLRDESATSPIVRQPPGYRLEADALDAREFLALADVSRAAVERQDWTAAIDAAQAALALWRGEVLADLRDDEWARLAAVPLDERRAACTEELVTALLGAGRTAAALDAARGLYDAHPLRERACWLYVLALHREGRTIEALDVHRAMVRRLDEELGLDPGPALQELQGALLRHDPALATWPNSTTAVPQETAAPREAESPEPVAPAGLVGRAAELDLVDAALARAADGDVQWSVLSGPAGIGKTRLAEEAMARAAARGFRLLRALCPDDEGVPPWWPVEQLLRALGADPGPVLAQDPGAEADRARFAVYERIREVLVAAAADAPLAVLVDDVQWADPSTLGLLRNLTFALDGVPVAVLLTVRTGVDSPDLRRLFDSLARRPGTQRIPVPPLAAAEVGELVRQVSGEAAGRDETALLLTRTGGNPFFVSEYARLPRAEREAGEIPLAVRAVLDRRLDALDAGALQVLRTAAVVGDVLDIGLLRTVTRLDVDELADLLDEAADERIVVVAPGSRSYAFAHGLLRETLVAGMSDVRRQRVHARVAAATPADDLPRRAGHLLAAYPLVEAEEVFAACRAAAGEADARWHTDAAAHWWEAAVSSYDRLAVTTPEGRDDLVRRRLAALIRAGRGQTLYTVVDEEVAAALRDGRTASIGFFCRILMRSTGAWPWAAFGADPGPLLARLQAAAPQVADDPGAHARVLAALAIGSCYDPDGTVPDRLSHRAVEIAEGLGDPDVLADTLLGRALTFSGIAGRVDESAELIERLGALPHANDDLDAVIAHGLMTMVCLTRGDIAGAAEHCRVGTAGSDALRLPISRVQFRLTESVLALWDGRFDEAERLYLDGLRLREQVEIYFGYERAAIVVSRWKQGRLDTLPDVLEGASDAIADIALAVATGDTALADTLIGAWLADEGPVIWTSAGNWTLLAHLCTDLGLVRHAPALLTRLEPLLGLIGLVGQISVVGPVALAVARLQHLTGDTDAARRNLADALALARRAGGRPSELACRLFALELDGPEPDTVRSLVADAGAAGVPVIAERAKALLVEV